MLWRPYDHHRDFRTQNATAWSAAGAYTNPDDGVVIRHGQAKKRVEKYPLATPNKRGLALNTQRSFHPIMQIRACLPSLQRAKPSPTTCVATRNHASICDPTHRAQSTASSKSLKPHKP
jgi:hypothetical protein